MERLLMDTNLFEKHFGKNHRHRYNMINAFATGALRRLHNLTSTYFEDEFKHFKTTLEMIQELSRNGKKVCEVKDVD